MDLPILGPNQFRQQMSDAILLRVSAEIVEHLEGELRRHRELLAFLTDCGAINLFTEDDGSVYAYEYFQSDCEKHLVPERLADLLPIE